MATAAPSIGGMILLEPGNRILHETVLDKVTRHQEGKSKPDYKPEPIDVRLCDFDDVQYRVSVEKEKLNVLQVQMSLPCFNEIKEFADVTLNRVYGASFVGATDGYQVTLHINMDEYAGAPAELAEKVSLLKTHTVGSVFDKLFSELQSGSTPSQPFKFSLRNDTTVYFFPGAERVTVIFAMDFKERSDRAIAKIFLQEFADSRRHLGAAPPCAFNNNPPMEMKHFGITEPISQDHLGFVSFALLKNHVEASKKDRVVGILQSFRNYLQYHIKCSKAYFHSRMRARVVSLLKVLNRAKQDPEEDVAKKTISGKSFVRNKA